MDYLWILLLIASLGAAMATGNASAAADAILQCGERAVSLAVKVTAAMMLWSGLLSILQETGDVRRISRLLRRLLRPLFPDITDDAAWEAIGLNLSANVLGLGNAATPPGMRAARLLAEQGTKGRYALAMLLAINCSSVQLIPTTVIALRAANGAADAASIWPACVASSASATVVAIVGMLLVQSLQRKREGARRA